MAFFFSGDIYDYRMKISVGRAYIQLFSDCFPASPTIASVAAKAKVSRTYASKVVSELLLTGTLVNPEIIKQQRKDDRVPTLQPTREEEMFLLSLWSENPSRPNLYYTKELFEFTEKGVTSQFIGGWFRNRFDNAG